MQQEKLQTIRSKRKPRGNVGLFLSVAEDLVTKNFKKDEVLDAFSICIYKSDCLSGISGPQEQGKFQSKEDSPSVEDDQV